MTAEADPWFLADVLANGDGPVARWQRSWRAEWLRLADDPLGRVARAQGFVVTTAQMRAHDMADHDLRREVRRRRWSVPRHGTASPVAITPIDDRDHDALRRGHVLSATATTLVRADEFISGSSAATVHGLPTMSVPPSPQLTVGHETTSGRRSGAHVFAAALPPSATTRWYGAPVTTVARTVVDQARHDRRNGIMAADAALRANLVSVPDLHAAVAGAAGWPGVRQAREIVELADPRADGPLESITRLALHDDGFPPFDLQVHIGQYWVDLLSRTHRLVIECDGRVKYTGGDALEREKLRQHRLAILGYRVERIMWEDIVLYWPRTRIRLWAALHGA